MVLNHRYRSHSANGSSGWHFVPEGCIYNRISGRFGVQQWFAVLPLDEILVPYPLFDILLDRRSQDKQTSTLECVCVCVCACEVVIRIADIQSKGEHNLGE